LQIINSPENVLKSDLLTTVILCLQTALSLVASGIAIANQIRGSKQHTPKNEAANPTPIKPNQPEKTSKTKLLSNLLWISICIGGALIIYRAMKLDDGWQPLKAHVDGLIMICVLFAGMVIYLQSRGQVRGLIVFALPVLTLLYAWSICASVWTLTPFEDSNSVWMVVHLGSVYAGLASSTIAAIAGGMYLFVQRQLRTTNDPTATKPFASLEATERLIIRTAAYGFALLTLGLITGLVITIKRQHLGDGWWYSPKVVLSGAVWLLYALVMNVRYTVNFRGARAAWLSIIGLLLFIATFGIATALTPSKKEPEKQTTSAVDAIEQARIANPENREAI
jgi:ABC-type uncharacterized transport system permease subunit